MSAPAAIRIASLSKRFDGDHGAVIALDDVNLTIPAGSIASIVGASGCGKSTLLRIVAGLERRYDGRAELDGRPVPGPGRDRGVVFQDHRLLPWLTALENVAFALGDLPKDEAEARARDVLALVGLADFAHARPAQLSGGMAQRVAIARALAPRPGVLLLDEPFGALDAMTKILLQQELLRIWRAERTTMILVTHDIDEAIYLGDQVIVLSSRPGRVKKILPVSLDRPRDRSSPGFIELRKQIFGEFFAEADAPFAYAI